MRKSAKTRHGFRFDPRFSSLDGCWRGRVRAVNPPCPWLPRVEEILDYTITRRHGRERGAEFYQDTLRYAQSQWISGKPAQAILQLDKALMADLAPDDPVWRMHPAPYDAFAWIMHQAAGGICGYMGNPVRHFQHLASRMSGPRSQLRSWRAWCCMHLAERILPGGEFPRDGRQLAREGIRIPGFGNALSALHGIGWGNEALRILSIADAARANPQSPHIGGKPFISAGV